LVCLFYNHSFYNRNADIYLSYQHLLILHILVDNNGNGLRKFHIYVLDSSYYPPIVNGSSHLLPPIYFILTLQLTDFQAMLSVSSLIYQVPLLWQYHLYYWYHRQPRQDQSCPCLYVVCTNSNRFLALQM